MDRREEEEEMKGEREGGCDEEEEPAEGDVADADEGTNGGGGDGDRGEGSDECEEQTDDDEDGKDYSAKKKVSIGRASCPGQKCVPGIIYLGHIPPRLRPKHLRNMLSSYGEIGRIFLQPEGNRSRVCPLLSTVVPLSVCVLPRPPGEEEEEEVWLETL